MRSTNRVQPRGEPEAWAAAAGSSEGADNVLARRWDDNSDRPLTVTDRESLTRLPQVSGDVGAPGRAQATSADRRCPEFL